MPVGGIEPPAGDDLPARVRAAVRLPSFTHFVIGLYGSDDAREVTSWHEAAALAEREGYTCLLGVTWDATQLLTLDGRAAGEPIALPR